MMLEVKFKDTFDFQKKSKIKAGDGLKFDEGEYPFYTSSNTLTKSINEYLFKKESLIFGTGGLASIHYCDEKFAVSTDCFVIQPKNREEVFLKYVYYYLSGNIHILENGFKGAGLKHISKGYISDIKIPLPPIEQQKKIAAILDAADTYRQKTKALITKYDELTQSLFLDMFGDPVRNPMKWKVKSLGNLTNLVTDGKHGNCNDEIDSGYYFVSAKNIKNNKIYFEESRQIPKEEFEEVDKRTNLQAGDLVMINTGATIGRMAIAENIPETRRCTFQKSVAIIKVKPEYLTSVFLMYVFELRLASFASKGSGSAIKNLLLSAMKRFKIIIPPIDQQNQFAERVKAIETQKAQAQASLVQAENLFHSLLQRAFKGELV
ncbi:hypothetical protein GCM10011416_01030 [Polaribacter pacificus]|uniref:Type I restriction modification DNA specificity domain-containing protein n=1 Tax=Polaribacter pacificus TaxID=1775173 RepID=A0A917HT95_9FLAO|nr:restriction endonuclease subunit S [Polaribacter pacificus]GGG88560.1 hypothetical protein GCM10011416_01030 [Polaribacter pacificus]